MQQRLQRFENIYNARREMENWRGRKGAGKKIVLKIPINTHHKQIKRAEPVRAEAIKQINKMADFSTPRSWGRIRRKKIYMQILALLRISMPLRMGKNCTPHEEYAGRSL